MLTASLAALLLFPLYKIVQACSDGPDPYDYYPSFFQPAVLREPGFMPFHYTAQLRYYDEWYDFAAEDSATDANIAAWKTFTGGVPEADLDSFIYAFPYATLRNLYDHLEKGTPLQLARAEAGNGMTAWCQKTRDLEALGYLMYAKQCEPFVVSAGDWEAPKSDTARMGRLARNGLQLRAAAKQDFFKERYAYQVLRLTLYAQKPKQALELYSQLFGNNEGGSEIAARALGLKAGALYRLKRRAEAAYYFTRVFDRSDNWKRRSFISFDWSVKDIGPVLALCKTPHEKAVVYLMDGLHNAGALPQLQAAYAADPATRGLDVLMLREINSEEDSYQQYELLRRRNLQATGWWYHHYEGEQEYTDGPPDSAAQAGRAYIGRLNAFAQQVAAGGKAGHAAFWRLASAYLCFMTGDMAGARSRLDAAAAQAMTPRERDLQEIIGILCAIGAAGRMDAKTEEALLPEMQWLDSRAAKDKHLAKAYRDLMSTVLSTAYLKSGDTAKAIYCLARTDRAEDGTFNTDDDFTDLPGVLLERLSTAKLREVEAFAGKSGKSRWDAWLTAGTEYTAGALGELEGTKYLRDHQFAKAAEALGRVPLKDLRKYVLPDPFVVHVKDMLEPEEEADTLHPYTKLDFAKKMAGLEGRTDAAGLFQYGCGLYGMSYYGKAHHAFDYYRSTSDRLAYFSTPERRLLPPALQEYYNLTSAERSFIRAVQGAADADLRAKAVWMAARCWQKRAPLAKATSYYSGDEEKAYYRYALTNPYFTQLSGQSPFVQEAYSTCGYLKDYAAGKK